MRRCHRCTEAFYICAQQKLLSDRQRHASSIEYQVLVGMLARSRGLLAQLWRCIGSILQDRWRDRILEPKSLYKSSSPINREPATSKLRKGVASCISASTVTHRSRNNPHTIRSHFNKPTSSSSGAVTHPSNQQAHA